MKDNKELNLYLNEYLRMKKPQFAVMISGKWGCGKTYYIENKIAEWSKKKEKANGDSVFLKPIYVSVNGLTSIGSVVGKIKAVLHPVLYSKGAKVAKKVVLAAMNIAVKSKVDIEGDGTGEDLNSLLDAEGILDVFMSDSASVKGNKILVIDDIERSKIPLDELFGFVNGIVEHSNSKVILICDESKLIKVAKKEQLSVEYKDFKEKLVGQTFSLEADYSSITGDFIEASGCKILQENRNIITDLFIASKCENLRLIRRCLIDIKRFFNQLPNSSIENNTNYKEFVTNVVAYLTIASIEDRFGNKEVELYQSFGQSDTDKKDVQIIAQKYDAILEKHGLYNSAFIIPIEYLVSFVRTGFISSPGYLVSHCRLLQSRNLTNWERLWNCSRLSNKEFITILESEKKRFYNKELEYAFEVVHLAGILLSLEHRGLVKLSRKNVVRFAKSNILEINKKYPSDAARYLLNSQGYEFQESGTFEMQEILSFSREFYQKRIKKQETDYVVSVWDSMDDDLSYSWLNKKFEESTPTGRSYSMGAIFKQVSPTYLANKLANLSNNAKIEFSHFLISRYYLKGSNVMGSLDNEVKADKETLEKISKILKSKSKRQKLIDKENTLNIANKIDEAIKKM